MKDTLYTHSVDKIKAPQNLLDKSLSKMRSFNNESEVIIVKSPKRKIIKFTSAIAAVLAVTIAIGAVYCTQGKDDEHPFVLTANAAEITPETYIEMGELKAFSSSDSYKTHVSRDKNGNLQKTDDNVELIYSIKEFNIDMQCIGENIESITYTANNSYLTYDPTYEGNVDCVYLTKEETDKYNAFSSTGNYFIASSCTYAYDKQPQSSLDFQIPKNGIDGTFPLRMAFTIFFEEGEYIISNDEHLINNTAKVFSEAFNKNADEYSLDVTANFKDGTKTTKTLTFHSEYTGDNRLLFYAKEAI